MQTISAYVTYDAEEGISVNTTHKWWYNYCYLKKNQNLHTNYLGYGLQKKPRHFYYALQCYEYQSWKSDKEFRPQLWSPIVWWHCPRPNHEHGEILHLLGKISYVLPTQYHHPISRIGVFVGFHFLCAGGFWWKGVPVHHNITFVLSVPTYSVR